MKHLRTLLLVLPGFLFSPQLVNAQQACTSNSDCQGGEICKDLGFGEHACLPAPPPQNQSSAPANQPAAKGCSSDNDCAAGEKCISIQVPGKDPNNSPTMCRAINI